VPNTDHNIIHRAQHGNAAVVLAADKFFVVLQG
jgi:hypothetical protein